MGNTPYRVFFNECQRLSIVQGESSQLDVVLSDERAHQPVDLTGANVTFSFPSMMGTSIKRGNADRAIDLGATKLGDEETVFVVSSNGYVLGDALTLTAAEGATLPLPLVSGSTYIVTPIDADTFTLTDTSGAVVLLAEPSTMLVAASDGCCKVTTPILGKLTLTLPPGLTAQLPEAQGQDYQVSITKDGYTRILIGRAQLDIFAQPAP